MAKPKPELVEDFFGVYLLYCCNPRYKGRTYIGYTRDPNRRITQHNKGTAAGGAYKTSNRGPWKMVLIIHGFPNNISALRFEWAWQNPNKTIRLQHLNLRKLPRKETVYQFKLRVLSEMLQVGPWCRLPLMIRWLDDDYFQELPADRQPPNHMKIIHGPIKSRNLKKKTINNTPTHIKCLICSKYITDHRLTCLNKNCDLICHLTCLAKLFLPPGEYIPIEGKCPSCNQYLKWGDLIRKMKGCDDNRVIEINDEDLSDVDENNSDLDDNWDCGNNSQDDSNSVDGNNSSIDGINNVVDVDDDIGSQMGSQSRKRRNNSEKSGKNRSNSNQLKKHNGKIGINSNKDGNNSKKGRNNNKNDQDNNGKGVIKNIDEDKSNNGESNINNELPSWWHDCDDY